MAGPLLVRESASLDNLQFIEVLTSITPIITGIAKIGLDIWKTKKEFDALKDERKRREREEAARRAVEAEKLQRQRLERLLLEKQLREGGVIPGAVAAAGSPILPILIAAGIGVAGIVTVLLLSK